MIINRIFSYVRRKSTPGPRLLESSLDSFLTSQVIASAIIYKKPFLVTRLGFEEARCQASQEYIDNPSQYILERIWRHAGVFPPTVQGFQTFSARYLESLASADLLGLIRTGPETLLVEKYAPHATTTNLGSLEPFLCSTPWSQYLAGKRVVVVHPFAESILSQYKENREWIFFNKNVLPQFDLRVVRAPQTISGNTDGFTSWSHALNHLIHETGKQEYDVAIIGCGAYGMPLGAHIKASGKVAIHLGGATQLLFGVSGKRWRDNPTFAALMNESWRPPLESERPPGWERVEEGCYW